VTEEASRSTFKPPGPLKPRIDFVVRRIEIQFQKLDKAADRFTERDKFIFDKIVKAYSKRDMPRANVFAKELAEIRKMEIMIMHARLALEQIVLELSKISVVGDVVPTLSPILGMVRSVRNKMSATFPGAEEELGRISNLLSGIIVDAGLSTGGTINFETANDEARKILDEKATIAEQKIKEKFPELPAFLRQKEQD